MKTCATCALLRGYSTTHPGPPARSTQTCSTTPKRSPTCAQAASAAATAKQLESVRLDRGWWHRSAPDISGRVKRPTGGGGIAKRSGGDRSRQRVESERLGVAWRRSGRRRSAAGARPARLRSTRSSARRPRCPRCLRSAAPPAAPRTLAWPWSSMADPHVQLARAVLPDDVGVATQRSHRPRWEATLPLTTATGAMETSPPTSTGTTARVLSSVILPRCACGAVLGRCRRLISGAQCGHSEPAELLIRPWASCC
jgi:hypothetical protein